MRARWTLYVDESGAFADPEDDVAIAGLLVSDELPGLSPAELKRSLNTAVRGFPWPWHARLLSRPSWIAIILAEFGVPVDDPDPDVRWLAEAVKRVDDCFERRSPTVYRKLRKRISESQGGDIDLDELGELEDILRKHCRGEREALRAHGRRAWVAVKRFAEAMGKRAAGDGELPLAMLVCGSETARGDAVGEPDTGLGDRRYFKLLEVLIDRCAGLLARRGGAHELILDVSERKLIDPSSGGRAKLNLLYLRSELSDVISRWAPNVRIVPAAVTPFNSEVGVRFVVTDFAANHARRELRGNATALAMVEAGLTTRMGLSVRSGTPTRSHIAASGAAYDLIARPSGGSNPPEKLLPFVPSRRRWACEQAWEWSRSEER